ncbi:MAG: diaminopimelate epimerase [Candidatus Omnitrophota bacterium]
MSRMKFTKMVASGNDFIVIDKTSGRLSALAVKLCDRRFGIGADGLLVLEEARGAGADFRMRIFNPDGSEPSMCGNGARCIALYAFKNKIAKKDMVFETLAGNIAAHVKGNSVKVKMSNPAGIKCNIPLTIGGKKLSVHRINTGVPHVVYFTDNLDRVDVSGLGRPIRYHKKFAPAGTNVNFVETLGKNKIKIRTYERGVEGETLACGTGSAASAIISALYKDAKAPVGVLTRSGEVLSVYFKKLGSKFSELYLEGSVKVVFNGEVLT